MAPISELRKLLYKTTDLFSNAQSQLLLICSKVMVHYKKHNLFKWKLLLLMLQQISKKEVVGNRLVKKSNKSRRRLWSVVDEVGNKSDMESIAICFGFRSH